MEVNDLIETTVRESGNKGLARRLRAAGRMNGSVYGHGVAETTADRVHPKTFDLQRRRFGKGHLFQLTIDGGNELRVQLKSIDRDPVKRTYTHLDFYAVDMNQPIAIEVPLVLEGKAKGIVNGGILTQLQRRVEVSCLPANVPEKLTADVTELDVNGILHLSDVVFPEGVKATAIEDEAVARVAPPSGKAASESSDGEEGASS